MEKILQNIIFPHDNKLKSHWGLFYRGVRCIVNEKQEMILFKDKHVDFATYLNGFPINKWRKYTKLKNVKLHLEIQGKFEFFAIGYHLQPLLLQEHFHSDFYTFHQKNTLVFEYPEDNTEEMLTFELHALEDCIVYGGYFTAEFEDEDVREVELALATTTCKKEDYITKNIALIKEHIIESEDEISQHFHLHVIDNGRTLDANTLSGDRITVHPNKNVGGAGGFARGMIEAMRQEKKATHVLLMDDDVLVLPESIKRTYTLLTVLREEYYDSFISGAMLEMEEMFTQHEDIGYVNKFGQFASLKGRMNQLELVNNLKTNGDFSRTLNQYAAWWYCCIPTTVIDKNKLPLPLFIRTDDVEYSLRVKASIISMSGICIWHMSFNNKFSGSMSYYQEPRNLLITRSVSNIYQNSDLLQRIRCSYRENILKFSYTSAEMCLDALEDYLKGPEHLATLDGEKVFIGNNMKNEKFLPLETFPDVEVNVEEIYSNHPLVGIERWIYRITYNGHRLIPEPWLRMEISMIGYDWSYQPKKQSLRKSLLAVNPITKVAHLRCIDKKMFKKLQCRYRLLMKQYKKNHSQIEQEYSKAKEHLTSEEFWKKYLEID